MYMTLWPVNHKGYALVIVMGLLVVLTVMALSLGAATRVDLEQTRRFQDETAAELLAKAGIDWTIHYLNTVERQGTLWQAPWSSQAAMFREHHLGPGTFDVQYADPSGTLHYGLQDEEARVNLNTASAVFLAALPGVDQALATAIVEQRQQEPWRAPEELLHRGLVSASMWHGSAGQAGLGVYLTVWGSGKINVNTASPVILAAVPDMTPAMVEALVHYRQGEDQQLETTDDRYFRRVADLAMVPGIDQSRLDRVGTLLTVTSNAFRFIATGRVSSATGQTRTLQRLVVLERTAQGTALRYWRQVD